MFLRDQRLQGAAAIFPWGLAVSDGEQGFLGSGLGSVAEQVTERVVIPYEEIPHFAKSTAHGHAGQLVCGLLEGVPVVVELSGGFSAQ